eukprot:PhF_6_TR35764/c0_g1_i2/m.51964
MPPKKPQVAKVYSEEILCRRAQQRDDIRSIIESWNTRRQMYEQHKATCEEHLVEYAEEHLKIQKEIKRLYEEREKKKLERAHRMQGKVVNRPNLYCTSFFGMYES